MPATVETSAFVIRELTGDQREVRLTGRALPYRPLELALAQRVDVEWYPGNPEGVGTVLGSQLESTTIRGEWKDKYLGEKVSDIDIAPMAVFNDAVSTIEEATKLFESLLRRGQLMEVKWAWIVRQGFMRSFRYNIFNTHDISWEITFDWISFGEGVPPPVISGAVTTQEQATFLRKSADELTDVLNPEFSVDRTVFDVLSSHAARIEDFASNAFDTATSLAQRVTTPLDTARRSFAIATGVVDRATLLLQSVSSRAAQALRVDVAPEQLSFTDGLIAQLYVNTVDRTGRSMLRAQCMRRTYLSRSLESNLIAVHEVRHGQDLRAISSIYYRSPHQWRYLMQYNELQSSIVDAGQVLMIPRLPSSGTDV